MIVEFDKSFGKSINKLKDISLYPKIEETISLFESAKSLTSIPNLKKLRGFKDYYRYRLGDFRLGMERIDEKTIRFILIAHRKDIYKIFP